eukprot:TRINITY_DN3386_c0_g1_i2.p1 TRINITY_DN3386_c0_g1~~TRINITY_DN3386_c0_g1_i2.p1  ORF type:complete len:183 (-),score=20.65 TRINITY_DN3386_c0_g1_i2:357-905(-)
MLRSLVGSEMCIRDRYQRRVRGCSLGCNVLASRNRVMPHKPSRSVEVPRAGVFLAVLSLAGFFSFMGTTVAHIGTHSAAVAAITSAGASYLASVGTCFVPVSPRSYATTFLAAVAGTTDDTCMFDSGAVGACLFVLVGGLVGGYKFLIAPVVVASAVALSPRPQTPEDPPELCTLERDGFLV